MTKEINDLTSERAKTHGDFDLSSLFVRRVYKEITNSPNFHNLTPPQERGLRMIVEKLSRVLYGDSQFFDHWIDIEGYAKLINDSILYKE